MRCFIALLLGLGACSGEDRPAPAFELRAVSQAALAGEPARPALAAVDPERLAGLRALIVERQGMQGKMRALALQDLAAAGDDAVAAAADVLSDDAATDAAKRSALDVLGEMDTPASTLELARRVDIQMTHEPWLRAAAAFQLGHASDDVAVPRLCAQLKYETDGETVIWIAVALAKHRNYAGLDGLRVLAESARTADLRARAQAVLEELAAETGFDDAETLHAAWHSADAEQRVPREEPSPALRVEIWRRVSDLGAFDLKLVDDARFVLSRSPWWVVDVLTQALHEELPHMRVCAAQSLERMGARGSAACPELLLGLEEPRLAPAAATALAGIGCPGAVEPLVRCTEAGHDVDLQHAAARALGVYGSQPAVDALTGLLENADSPDLRQTAAEALVETGHGARAAPLLLECLTRPGADPDAAEKALEAWLDRATSTGSAAAAETLDAWRGLGGDPGETATVTQAAERHRLRAELLRERLPRLLSDSE